jgi:hypothetical protein
MKLIQEIYNMRNILNKKIQFQNGITISPNNEFSKPDDWIFFIDIGPTTVTS